MKDESIVKKIDTIKNMAVFKDFQWSASVRDKGNNISEFAKINILYGRNYSGKTTLSRIFRALETGFISDKYNSPEFQLSFENGKTVTQKSLKDHGQVIRVFNEDFIRDNLRFIIDDNEAINSFAILGEDNTKLKEEIEKLKVELGSEADDSGLLGELKKADKELIESRKVLDNKSEELEKKLIDKANNRETGIKHNRYFGQPTYNIAKLKNDINTVNQGTYSQLTKEDITELYSLLKEEPKSEISESSAFNLRYSSIISKAKKLIEKEIKASAPIQELLHNAVLATWVRNGRDYHQDKRETCAFCGNVIPQDLWEKLDKHFNQESEALRQSLQILEDEIKNERMRVPNLLKIKNSDFYITFTKSLDELSEELSNLTKCYIQSLDVVIAQVEKRRSDIFTPFEFKAPNSIEDDLNKVRDVYEQLRKRSNEFTASLSSAQGKARDDLRLHEVYTFITDIKYTDEIICIETLATSLKNAEGIKDTAQQKVNTKQEKISELSNQLKDERRGAERVNYYLNNIFGHPYLSLKAIKENSSDTSSGYRFEITRNNQKAFHLSEGECSLIAFCYFIAKLEDIETVGNQPIIWIDDPICSLDADHIFFIYSLIYARILTPEKYKDGEQENERDRYKQIFISTHNLDFLKYLQRLPGARHKTNSQYFIITRFEEVSEIRLMPNYLKEYVTEFNFLFHQIHKCANAIINQSDEDYNCYYNFGNNARKFLEVYMYYKYPNGSSQIEKLETFFGKDELALSLVERVNNEFSHLSGVLERSVVPIDVPEIKKIAKFILKKIEEKDPEQYAALLKSIDVKS